MTRILGAIAFVLISAVAVSAHHSYAAFDRAHPITIEGTIGRVLFANPHVIFTVETAGKTYDVEWGNLGQMSRYSVTKDTLGAGDRVLVTGSPTVDPADNRFSIVLEIRRPSDGWHWGRPQTS